MSAAPGGHQRDQFRARHLFHRAGGHPDRLPVMDSRTAPDRPPPRHDGHPRRTAARDQAAARRADGRDTGRRYCRRRGRPGPRAAGTVRGTRRGLRVRGGLLVPRDPARRREDAPARRSGRSQTGPDDHLVRGRVQGDRRCACAWIAADDRGRHLLIRPPSMCLPACCTGSHRAKWAASRPASWFRFSRARWTPGMAAAAAPRSESVTRR